jgi:hypothetical protein
MNCETCPVDGPCHADHPSRRRLCALVAGGRADYRRLVVERSRGLPPSPRGDVGTVLRSNAALNARVRACPHRDCRGCGSAKCLLHGRLVSYSDCHACPDLPPAERHNVSIVVAARNCGRWLAESLRSALDQHPLEVIYVDDASDDDSAGIARGIDGVKVLVSERREGVCAARDRGDAAASGVLLLHLDGDDLLPRGFLAAHLAALDADPGAALAYSGADHFGAREQSWGVQPWDAAKLANGNHVHTSTLVRASVVREVGGWREGIGTAWDWDLWLRVAAAGHRGVPVEGTRLRYRQHDANITDAQGLRDPATGLRLNLLMRLQHARPAVCCVLSDRLPDLWPAWFARAAECAWEFRQWAAALEVFQPFGKAPDVPVDLVVIYTGDRPWDVRLMADDVSGDFADVSVIGQRWKPEGEGQDYKDSVSRGLAGLYNRFLDLPNNTLWFLEDDILPPPDALIRLTREMFSGVTIEPAVAGWYRTRHNPDRHVIANRRDHAGVMRPVASIQPGRNLVDLTGTGCLLIHKPLISARFTSHWRDAAAHDFAFCAALGHPVVIVGEVECRHHRTAAEWV